MLKVYKDIVVVVMDVMEAVGLLLCSILASPFFFLRSSRGALAFVWSIKALVPRGLLAAAVRAGLDEKLGNHEQAAATYNQLVRMIESEETRYKAEDPKGRVMTDLYSRLLRLHLENGRMDDATLVMIRAHRFLGIDSLPVAPEFDIKTAHIVKAGIAAGRLLDEGGLATLTVRGVSMHKKDTKDLPTPRAKVWRKGQDSLQPPLAKVIPFIRPQET